MSETSFWTYLRKLLPREGHYTRLENHDTGAGIPDVVYTLDGVTGFIELKDSKRPGAKYPFKGESGLRRSQLTWIRDQLYAEGIVYLALQCGNRGYLLSADLYFDELARMTEDDICRVSLLQWTKGAKRNDKVSSIIKDSFRVILQERP